MGGGGLGAQGALALGHYFQISRVSWRTWVASQSAGTLEGGRGGWGKDMSAPKGGGTGAPCRAHGGLELEAAAGHGLAFGGIAAGAAGGGGGAVRRLDERQRGCCHPGLPSVPAGLEP